MRGKTGQSGQLKRRVEALEHLDFAISTIRHMKMQASLERAPLLGFYGL